MVLAGSLRSCYQWPAFTSSSFFGGLAASWPMKKGPWLVGLYRRLCYPFIEGLYILKHGKDPYETTRIQWKITCFFSWLSRFFLFFLGGGCQTRNEVIREDLQFDYCDYCVWFFEAFGSRRFSRKVHGIFQCNSRDATFVQREDHFGNYCRWLQGKK